MSARCYEVVSGSGLAQGDILVGCPLVVPVLQSVTGAPNLEAILSRLETAPTVAIRQQDTMVLTQTCDLEQGKTETVLVCPIYSLALFVVNSPDLFGELQRVAKQQNRVAPVDKDALTFEAEVESLITLSKNIRHSLEEIRRRQRPLYHMVPAHPDLPVRPISIVDFRQLYPLSKALAEAAAQVTGNRLRMTSPLREHLSESFGRYFSRVALPSDLEIAPFR